MNKYKTLLLFLLVTTTIKAQEGWILGIGPTLELEEELVGINARLYYGLNEQICFGPEISIYPSQEIEDENELSVVDLNFNGHYIFEVSHKLGIYPLTGLNYTIEKERFEMLDESETTREFGVNYGLGAHYNLGKLFVFAEFKGIISQLSDEFITAGVIFSLSKSKKEKIE